TLLNCYTIVKKRLRESASSDSLENMIPPLFLSFESLNRRP
ncbi:hypothetical protein A2U01_0018335, partial [Trifolium medium]|nr:hypothetical protein [Trifolium medium]